MKTLALPRKSVSSSLPLVSKVLTLFPWQFCKILYVVLVNETLEIKIYKSHLLPDFSPNVVRDAPVLLNEFQCRIHIYCQQLVTPKNPQLWTKLHSQFGSPVLNATMHVVFLPYAPRRTMRCHFCVLVERRLLPTVNWRELRAQKKVVRRAVLKDCS